MKVIQTSEFVSLLKSAQGKLRQSDIKKMMEWRATQAAPTVPVQMPAAPVRKGKGGKGPATAPDPTAAGDSTPPLTDVGQPGPAPLVNPALANPPPQVPTREQTSQIQQMQMMNRQMAMLNPNNLETPEEAQQAQQMAQQMDGMAKMLDQKAKQKQQLQQQPPMRRV